MSDPTNDPNNTEHDTYADAPVPFAGSEYSYRVQVGTVEKPNTISWDHTVYARTWDEARWLADLAHEHYDHPAVAIQPDFFSHSGDRPLP